MAKRKKNGSAATSAMRPPLPPKDNVEEDPQLALNERAVERKLAALEALKEAETEDLVSRLRLLRSYLTPEQLCTPALKFFEENFPNLSVVRNEKYGVLDLKRKEVNPGDDDNGGPDATGALQFSVDSVKERFLEATKLQFPDINWDEYVGNQAVGTSSMQTPGAMSGGISFGMTPKTVRVPKKGEILLSVRGSPLGVYKEEEDDNLAAIHESEDESADCQSETSV